jgi:hypothetical protein
LVRDFNERAPIGIKVFGVSGTKVNVMVKGKNRLKGVREFPTISAFAIQQKTERSKEVHGIRSMVHRHIKKSLKSAGNADYILWARAL